MFRQYLLLNLALCPEKPVICHYENQDQIFRNYDPSASLGTDPIYETRHTPSNSRAKAHTRKLSRECFLVKFLD